MVNGGQPYFVGEVGAAEAAGKAQKVVGDEEQGQDTLCALARVVLDAMSDDGTSCHTCQDA